MYTDDWPGEKEGVDIQCFSPAAKKLTEVTDSSESRPTITATEAQELINNHYSPTCAEYLRDHERLLEILKDRNGL